MSLYAVIDTETTGLSPNYNHRVLEIAVVLVNEVGHLVDEWDTLINPQRDVKATGIHGITDADVSNAPTFAQVANKISSLLAGRVPVAHNLSFDASFLMAEFAHLGVKISLNSTNGLCTMRMASRYLPAGRRNLESCCRTIGYKLDSAHAALYDARATANLLAHYIRTDNDFSSSWADVISKAQQQSWPKIPRIDSTDTMRLTRQQAAAIADRAI